MNSNTVTEISAEDITVVIPRAPQTKHAAAYQAARTRLARARQGFDPNYRGRHAAAEDGAA